MKNIINILRYLKTWKEDFIVILVAAVMFFAFRSVVVLVDPTAALYDLGRFEDLTYGIFKFFLLEFTAWIALRVTMPDAYKYLKNDFYPNGFKNLSECSKRNISLLAFLAFLFALVLLAK